MLPNAFLIAVFSFCFITHEAKASFESESQSNQSYLVAGIEAAAIKSSGATLTGAGPHASYLYFFNDTWAVEPGLSMAFGSLGSALLYTSLDANLQYSFFGAPLMKKMSIKMNNSERITVTSPSSSRLAASFGLTQLFLNGTQSVFPATGVGLGIVYNRYIFGIPADLEIRYTFLTSNNMNVGGPMLRMQIFFGL